MFWARYSRICLSVLIPLQYLWRKLVPEGVPPRFVLIFWPVVDRLLTLVGHIRPLKADDSGIIRFNLRRYKGPSRMLNDGSEVRIGDTLIELHINNDWFRTRRKLDLRIWQSPWEILNCFEEDLRVLAEQVIDGKFEGVVALRGVTFLHTGAKRLGFQIDELPDSLWKKGARFYMAGLERIYNLQTDRTRKRRGRPLELKEIWLSKAALLRRYGPEHESVHLDTETGLLG
jgi:hypothetical protein